MYSCAKPFLILGFSVFFAGASVFAQTQDDQVAKIKKPVDCATEVDSLQKQGYISGESARKVLERVKGIRDHVLTKKADANLLRAKANKTQSDSTRTDAAVLKLLEQNNVELMAHYDKLLKELKTIDGPLKPVKDAAEKVFKNAETVRKGCGDKKFNYTASAVYQEAKKSAQKLNGLAMEAELKLDFFVSKYSAISSN
jgi:hypothetical protein